MASREFRACIRAICLVSLVSLVHCDAQLKGGNPDRNTMGSESGLLEDQGAGQGETGTSDGIASDAPRGFDSRRDGSAPAKDRPPAAKDRPPAAKDLPPIKKDIGVAKDSPPAQKDLPPVKVDGGGSVAAFRFISWADTKTGTAVLTALSTQAKALSPAAVLTIYPGDLCDSGPTLSCLTTWTDSLNGGTGNGTSAITFVSRGNHDSSGGAAWQSFFNFAGVASSIGATSYSAQTLDMTYSFDYKNSHFVGLDCPGGDASTLGSSEITWLDNDLTAAEARGVTHSFVFFHGPVYYIDGHPDTPSPALLSALTKHTSVSATFHGHEHVLAYVHIDATRYASVTHAWEEFITGAAGASRYTCSGSRSPNWCDDQHNGFATVDVNGKSFTVSMYGQGQSSPLKTWSFTK